MRNGAFYLLLIILLCWPLAGCQARDVEQTALAVGIGIDWSDDNFLVSVQLAQAINPGQTGSQDGPQFIVLNGLGQTPSEGARRMNLALPRQPLWFHASSMILGEDLAKHGLTEMVDFLSRNINVRKKSLAVLARGATVTEIMQVDTPLEPHSAVAIKRILEVQEEQAGIYVPVTLGDFLYNLSTPGIDPVLPQVRIISDHGRRLLKIDGTAVFRGPNWVGELNETESQGFRFLSTQQIRGGLIVIPAPGDKTRHVTIELISSQAALKPIIKDGQLRMTVEINADGNFYDQTASLPLLNLDVFHQIEELAARKMEQDIYQAIRKAQGYQADIFGWGRRVNIFYPALWEQFEKDWPEIFSTMETDVKVHFKLRRTYLNDKSFLIK